MTRVLYWRFGPRRLIAAGLPVIAAATTGMAQADVGTSLWLVRLVMLGLGLGVSLVFIPNQAASMATITKAQTGRASSIFNAGKQLGAPSASPCSPPSSPPLDPPGSGPATSLQT